MWILLSSLVILVVVLLYQIGTRENFVVSDASGNPVTDASGNPVTVSAPTSTIQLTFADLLTLFKTSSTPVPSAPVVTTTTTPAATPNTITSAFPQMTTTAPIETADEFYEKIRPSLIKDIKNTITTQLEGAPFSAAAPVQNTCGGGCSDAMAQGVELTNAKQSLENNSDYIRKDSIPCYNCSL